MQAAICTMPMYPIQVAGLFGKLGALRVWHFQCAKAVLALQIKLLSVLALFIQFALRICDQVYILHRHYMIHTLHGHCVAM